MSTSGQERTATHEQSNQHTGGPAAKHAQRAPHWRDRIGVGIELTDWGVRAAYATNQGVFAITDRWEIINHERHLNAKSSGDLVAADASAPPEAVLRAVRHDESSPSAGWRARYRRLIETVYEAIASRLQRPPRACLISHPNCRHIVDILQEEAKNAGFCWAWIVPSSLPVIEWYHNRNKLADNIIDLAAGGQLSRLSLSSGVTVESWNSVLEAPVDPLVWGVETLEYLTDQTADSPVDQVVSGEPVTDIRQCMPVIRHIWRQIPSTTSLSVPVATTTDGRLVRSEKASDTAVTLQRAELRQRLKPYIETLLDAWNKILSDGHRVLFEDLSGGTTVPQSIVLAGEPLPFISDRLEERFICDTRVTPYPERQIAKGAARLCRRRFERVTLPDLDTLLADISVKLGEDDVGVLDAGQSLPAEDRVVASGEAQAIAAADPTATVYFDSTIPEINGFLRTVTYPTPSSSTAGTATLTLTIEVVRDGTVTVKTELDRDDEPAQSHTITWPHLLAPEVMTDE